MGGEGGASRHAAAEGPHTGKQQVGKVGGGRCGKLGVGVWGCASVGVKRRNAALCPELSITVPQPVKAGTPKQDNTYLSCPSQPAIFPLSFLLV